FSPCFTKIVICSKTNETLYDHLRDTIDNVEIFESGVVPPMSDYDSETSKLIIFDDLVVEPKRHKRKFRNILFEEKTIRINSQYVDLSRNLTERDLKIMLSTLVIDIIGRKIYRNVIEYVCDL
ncbi:TPA: hypothetical protein N0F65_001712, partial [Lagenidium giganteum]